MTPTSDPTSLKRLAEREDLVRGSDGAYRFDDPVLAHWLAGVG